MLDLALTVQFCLKSHSLETIGYGGIYCIKYSQLNIFTLYIITNLKIIGSTCIFNQPPNNCPVNPLWSINEARCFARYFIKL